MFKFFRRKKITQKSNPAVDWALPLQSGGLLDFGFGYADGIYNNLSDAQAMSFYRKNSSVATAVDRIADEVEQIKPVLRLPDGKLEKEHPVLSKLKNPNYYQTYIEFFGDLTRNYLITNNSYIYVSGAKEPHQIYSIKPQNISCTQATNKFPYQFIVSSGVGEGTYLVRLEKDVARYLNGELQELYQNTGYSSTETNIKGESLLLPISLEISQQIRGKIYNTSLLRNGARLSLLVKFKNSLKESDIRSALKHMQEQWSGETNAGIAGVASSMDYDVTEFGKTPKDMDFAILEKASKDVIFTRFKIPLPLISTDATTYNNMETAIENLYDWAVIPTYERMSKGLSRVLLPRYNLDPNEYTLTYNPEEIPALMTRRLNELKKRREINVETIDEYRSLIAGREDLKEGGNFVYIGSNQAPIGSDNFVGNNPTTTDEDDQGKKEIFISNDKNNLKLVGK